MDISVNDGSGSNAPTPTAAADYAASATGGSPSQLRDGATIAPAPKESDPEAITLSDGRKAKIMNQRGSAVPMARRLVDEKVDFQDALVSLAVLIEGRPIIPEELHALPLKDALALHSAFNEKNA